MFAWLLPLLVLASDPLIADQQLVNRGDVRIGPPLSQQFKLTNRGTKPVTLAEVTSTCGCLAPKLERRDLAPNATTTLTVEINTLSQPAGQVNWVTRVSYRSGGETHVLPLEVRANLIAEIRVEPASVAFSIRQTRSVDLTVTDSRAKPFRIAAVGTSLPQLKAELMPIESGKSQRIRLTASPKGASGVQSAVAWFTTDDPLYPQIKIPVTLTIPPRQRVVASPSVLDVSAGGSARVQLRDQEGKQVVVDRVEVEGPLTATVTASTGLLATLNIKCASNPNERDGTIIVHVREPVEQIRIPVIIR